MQHKYKGKWSNNNEESEDSPDNLEDEIVVALINMSGDDEIFIKSLQ